MKMQKAQIFTILTISLALLTLLSLTSFSTAQTVEELCEGADEIIPVDLMVFGENCHNSNQTTDSTQFSVQNEGLYNVFGIVNRGNPTQCQAFEEFFVEINGESGPISEDDADECELSTRLDPLGTFGLLTNNDLDMHTAAVCPPGETPNSVDLTHICIFLQDTPPNCDEDPDAEGCPEEPNCDEDPDAEGCPEDDDKDGRKRLIYVPDEYFDGRGLVIKEEAGYPLVLIADDYQPSGHKPDYKLDLKDKKPEYNEGTSIYTNPLFILGLVLIFILLILVIIATERR